MQTLSHQAFDRAVHYIRTQGRALEARLFDYHFADGDAAAVIDALAAFQNADGGFGHALEPDLRTPASSAIATSHGLHTLVHVGARSENDVVRRAVQYLIDSYDAQKKVWPIVPPEVEDAPHAPWWTHASIEENFGGFVINPRASLAARLYHYANLVPDQLLEEVTAGVLEAVAAEGETLDKNDLECVLELAGAENVPPKVAEALWEKLRAVAAASVEINPEKWTTYCLMPLEVAPRPDAPLAEVIVSEAIEANLDYLIEQQLDDGTWPLPWNWASVDEAAWANAEREWKGALALNNLRVLQAYGRID